PLGDWGTLTVAVQTVDRSAPAGTAAYHGTVVELDVKLTADHGGLPASSEIQIAAADVHVQTAPPSTAVTTPTATTPAEIGPRAGDLPSERPAQAGNGKPTALEVQPKLTAGRYVFPAYGPSSYIHTF